VIALAAAALVSWPHDARADEETPSTAEAWTSEGSPEQTAPPPPSRWRTPVGLRLDGAYSQRTLLELPVTGADMGLALGAQPSRGLAVWWAGRFFLGSTEHGLGVYTARLGADLDFVVDRLRFGIGPNLFLVGVSRAARDETILSWGPAAHVGLRLDFVRTQGYAMFVRADADAGWEIYDDSIYWGGALGAGVDFDLSGSRTEPTARLSSRTGWAAARSP
jgi:hypothetical protein